MIYTIYILSILMAYLFGSVPSSVWVGKLFYGVDVREHGSKNAGATNTFRVLGKKAGIPVLLFDILKGWLAVKITFYATSDAGVSFEEYTNLKLVLGVAAVIGHIFPIYVGFRGGKGVATILGVVLAVNPYSAMFSIAVFLIIFFTTHYISLSSMLGGLTYPIVIIGYYKLSIPSLTVFSIVVGILVLVTHQKNIERLLKGEESKIYFFRKKKDLII